MKLILTIITLGLLVITIFNVDCPLKDRTLYGMYVNTNYQNPICCVEAPHESDTLILYSDGNFESRFFGKGQFEMSNGISPRIELHYKSFGESALFSTYISNQFFGKTKIILNADMNHVYTKIN